MGACHIETTEGQFAWRGKELNQWGKKPDKKEEKKLHSEGGETNFWCWERILNGKGRGRRGRTREGVAGSRAGRADGSSRFGNTRELAEKATGKGIIRCPKKTSIGQQLR